MGKETGIEWTDHTFNPWIGCTKISEGCKNCYAKTRDDRHMLGPLSHWGPGAPRHITSAANWREPLAWANAARRAGTRAKVFCASQADIFELEAPVKQRRLLWELIGETHDALDWQLLTKRPENITPVMCDDGLNLGYFELTRCWLGTSTENQAAADARIPELLKVDAAVRFISAEPLLGPLNLGHGCADGLPIFRTQKGGCPVTSGLSGEQIGHMPEGWYRHHGNIHPWLDWVICGGESGPGARAPHPDWVRSLRDQCAAARVPFFFKQWGEWAPAKLQYVDGCVNHANGHDWFEVDPTSIHALRRIGKKAAGALLDGREWKDFPDPVQCEGCGAATCDPVEDEGMNMLCKPCATLPEGPTYANGCPILENDSPSADHCSLSTDHCTHDAH